MKGMFKVLAVVMLAVAGLVGTASAQDVSRTRPMQVNFEFHAGNRLMPAGEYEFQVISNGPQKLIRVREINTGRQAILSTVPSRNLQNLESGSVAFNKYGGQYFLSAVQLGDQNFVHSALKTDKERDIARQFNKGRLNTQPSGQ